MALTKLFRSLLPDDVDIIARYMHGYVAVEDTVVFREGEIGDAMLFIVEGMVHVYRGDPVDGGPSEYWIVANPSAEWR